MGQIIFGFLLMVLAAAAAVGMMLGLIGGLHIASRKAEGYFHYAIYAILLSTAITILFSGRDVTLNAISVTTITGAARHPVDVWVQRGSSVFLLLVAIERIASYITRNKGGQYSHLPLLLSTYIIFWICTVAITALWSAHPQVSHDYAYTLILGVAAILSSTHESRLTVNTARNAIFIFMVASVVLIPILPQLVIDTSYTQGLLPGFPRLAGLAPHALTLGVLAQVGFLLLWANPFESTRLNRLALLLSLIVLFLAQSKTAWLSFMFSSCCMAMSRYGASFKRRFNDPGRPAFSIGIILAGMALTLVVASAFLYGNVGQKVSQFLASDEGVQLTSLTGRDQIWRIAFEEWHRNPVLGYGLRLFDETYRTSIGMANAIHAHNQFVDTLARSGIIGATALVFYSFVLLALSVRYARTSAGLTIGLFVTLATRAITEVPMTLVGYGPEFILHMLLLVALAGEARKAKNASLKKNDRHSLVVEYSPFIVSKTP